MSGLTRSAEQRNLEVRELVPALLEIQNVFPRPLSYLTLFQELHEIQSYQIHRS